MNGVNGITVTATEAVDRLEDLFVHRVSRVLNALQIPTARDVHELNRRVAALTLAVERLERGGTPARARKPRRTA